MHAVNSGEADRLELARATLELRGLDRLVDLRPEAYPAGGPQRPRRTVLATGRLETLLSRTMRSWHEALGAYLRDPRP